MFNNRRNSYLYPLVLAAGQAFNREVVSIADKEYRISVSQSHSISQMPLSQRFGNLAATWKAETQLSPSVREMVSNQSYLRIVSMGYEVAPLILNELKREPDHWFPALIAITGVDPVPKEKRGDVQAMAESWLEWGKQNGVY